MRTIHKAREPASLAQHRATPHADYDNYGDKDTLRTALVTEQRGLCCYCLTRIRPEIGAVKVEHWHSQDTFPTEQLDYQNLLASCPGGQRQHSRQQHCDTKKGKARLSRNPANPAHRVESFIRYEADGRIVSNDLAFDAELNKVLNLNASFLKNNRKAVLDGFKGALAKRGILPRITLERWLHDWNGESHANELQPYCQVVVYWLRKRLSKV
jgi:uncharacterized protein (TIGR02646 family)